jgi:hypothetical protein
MYEIGEATITECGEDSVDDVVNGHEHVEANPPLDCPRQMDVELNNKCLCNL